VPSQSVLTCAQFSTSAEGVVSCSSQSWAETYVVTPEQQAQLELFIQGGFDQEAFTFFFTSTLMLFAVGFAAGIIISQIRKMRRGV